MDPQVSPICQCLRSKIFYTSGQHQVDLAECSPTAACWCLHTLTVLGPDDALCTPERCRPERSCFRGALAR